MSSMLDTCPDCGGPKYKSHDGALCRRCYLANASTRIQMPDGLYRYVWRDVVVGFVVEGGRIMSIAPWLRAKLRSNRTRDEWRYRMTTATRIGE